jgi:single-stranded-DNA-specific exonuclease
MSKEWITPNIDFEKAVDLSNSLSVSHDIAKLLLLRGVSNYSEAENFFRPNINQLHNPFDMKDMNLAIERIELAIQRNERVLIYGDYDVDGTTAVSMMFDFFSKYFSFLDYYIPDRYSEGYGVSIKSIDFAKKNEFTLIIALDCGIRAVKQIEYANDLNIDYIICDHHNPGEIIPAAKAILNPKQLSCNYKFKELSGCGVGFKLIQAFCIKRNINSNKLTPLLDLLAISIAADIVPIVDENRILMFYGLQQINRSPREGIKALINSAKKDKEIKISDILFGIAPLINAAGRILHGKHAVEVLVEKDVSKATVYAEKINEHNSVRKGLDKSITEEALLLVDNSKKSTVLFSDKWHKGVVGIVASRVIETFYKPTIILVEKNGILTGSARSVHDFDIYSAINECAYLCDNFGGHKYAAGLTIKKENINEFIDKFEQVVSEKIKKSQLMPRLNIDLEAKLEKIDAKFFRILKQFEPFGPKNPNPKFVSKDILIKDYRAIGKDKSHLKCIVDNGKGLIIEAIGFGLANKIDYINKTNELSICYSLSENVWNSKVTNQLILHDIK